MKKARGEVIRAGKAPEGAVRLKRKAVVEPRDLLGAVKKAVAESSGKHVGDGDPYGVDKAVDKVIKALSGPVAEKGDKKLTGDDGKGAQEDQAYAVAHGPDNYDKLTKWAAALAYGPLIKSAGAVIDDIEVLRKAGANFAVPGNLKEHLQKALAAVHGREIFDPRYKQACKLLKQVCDLMEAIEGEAEVVEGNSAAMVPGMGMGEGGGLDPHKQQQKPQMRMARRARR
jgi:hypothetical protein